MAMTTNYQLAAACEEHRIPLVGVYSKNELTELGRIKPGGYIINMCDSHDADGNPLGGTHWVAFWIDRDAERPVLRSPKGTAKKQKDGKWKACYFDSFGVAPPVDVQKFLARLRPYPFCSFQVQNVNSGVCGWYCLEFLHYMATERLRHPSVDAGFDAFLERYSYNPKQNRRLLEGFLEDI